jgi:hypothetical protein
VELWLILSEYREFFFAKNGADLMVAVHVVMRVVLLISMMSLPLVIVYIRLSKKKNAKGLSRMAYAATAKSTGASS